MKSKQIKLGGKVKQEKTSQKIVKPTLQIDEDEEESEIEEDMSEVEEDSVAETDEDASVDEENDDENEEEEEDDDDGDEDDSEEGDSDAEDVNDDSEDNGEEDAEESSEEEANEETIKLTKKRKAEKSPKQKNKKAKLETSELKDCKTLYLRLPSKNVETSVIEKFFADNQIEFLDVRRVSERNFSYVDIPTDQLEVALKLSGKKMAGKPITVEIAKNKPAVSEKLSEEKKTPKTKKSSKKDLARKKTLFVKNLPYNLEDEALVSHFPLASTVSAKRLPNGKLVGYAYVEFESEEIAEKVMTELQNSQIEGRTIALDYVGEKRLNTKPQQASDENCKTICVKQLSYDITKEELKAVFKKAKNIRIVSDSATGKPKGFGFVSFKSHADAAEAKKKMDGKLLKGRNLAVDFTQKASENPDKKKNKKKHQKKTENKKH